ncbi:hypothetical protein [Sulfuriroseicoccus oceanibius]|uniref:Uncharacterized protein n=1 Tax=Sulfuriroseicoccus oceanibius TaxID=2707525 RepID=A0A6B3L595_9BACT|nr:hypothetical protein [Sulfuriroseicoccus oceanibius]QQL44794.1 hypothetical protein G3M56_013075 [Sulfuriroseicoccus oceanibius]
MRWIGLSMVGVAAWLAVGDLAHGREKRHRETHKEKLERLKRERAEKREARRGGDKDEKACGCKRKCKCKPDRPPVGGGNQAQREQRELQRERQGEQRQNQRNAQQEQRERQRQAQDENR